MVHRPLGEASSDASRHTLPAIPSSVTIARHELDRVLDVLQLRPGQAADIRLAVTEACTNAVQHAYADGAPPGEMVITIDASTEALVVSVADTGHGIDAPSRLPGLGAGLPIIEAVADSLTVESLRPGTMVRMTFLPGASGR